MHITGLTQFRGVEVWNRFGGTDGWSVLSAELWREKHKLTLWIVKITNRLN